jgi:hypothetical protein
MTRGTIDLSRIDEEKMTEGEKDIYDVYVADVGDSSKSPAPLVIGLMRLIEERCASETADADKFVAAEQYLNTVRDIGLRHIADDAGISDTELTNEELASRWFSADR